MSSPVVWVLSAALALQAVPGLTAQSAADAMEQQRKDAAHRQRRIIFNNDGDDVLCGEPTREAFLSARTAALIGSQVDLIFYCASQGFGLSLYNSRVNDIRTRTDGVYKNNILKQLLAQGTDPLRIMVEFGHAHGIEVFHSMRMNDIHDANPAVPEMLPPFKKQHPEYLFGTLDNRPRYGQWSGVDFGRSAVRERAFRTIQEVCENYDVDGVELDFFRHPVFFKRHARGEPVGQQERDMMTGLIRRVRRMTEDVSLRRGRPILVAVRVPDSVGYCNAIGIDLPRWLQDDLVDILIASGYFRLSPWEETVALGHKYGVMVYPSLDESRIRADTRQVRNTIECYRARAMQAWAAGVDGIYLFNLVNPKAPHWRELGDPKKLEKLDKVYVVAARGFWQANAYLPGGDRFVTRPTLCPERPVTLAPGQAHNVVLSVGDDVLWGQDQGVTADVTLSLEVADLAALGDLAVNLNGIPVTGGTLADGWLDVPVSPELVKQGANRFDIAFRGTGGPPVLKDLQLGIRYKE